MSSFGSKATSGLYKMLLGLQPPHDLYSESHLGGGSLMRHKAPAVAAAGRYRHDDTKADHVALLDRLRGGPCPVMVSGHPSALEDEARRDGRRIDLPVMVQGPVRTEVVGVHLRARPDALDRPCVSRTPLAKANENRDGRIDADDASHLMDIAQPLYGPEDSERKRDETVYALDSSTIAFCLSLFPWAFFRKTTSGIKLHSLLDFQGNIPSFIAITDAKLKDVNGLDTLRPEPGAIYGMDRAYVDYERRHTRHHVGRYFGVRAKSNTTFQRRYSHKRDRNNGVIQDQSGVLTGAKSSIRYPRLFRRITCIDRENDTTRIVLTNNTYLPAETIAALDKNRGPVDLFFDGSSDLSAYNPFTGSAKTPSKHTSGSVFPSLSCASSFGNGCD